MRFLARLMENLAEQQTYLKELTHPGIQAELLRATHVQVSLKNHGGRQPRTLYEGQKYSFRCPSASSSMNSLQIQHRRQAR